MDKPKGDTPYRLNGVDITKLDLDTSDGFLWSLVDGGYGLRELGLITGFEAEEIALRLHRLARLGVIAWNETSSEPPVSMLPPPELYTESLTLGSLRHPGTSFDSVPTGILEVPRAPKKS